MTRTDDPAQLAARIAERAAGLRPLIALDHDGTLAPIVARPEDARLATGAHDVLRALTEVADVAIVSGRGLDDLARRFTDLPVTLVSEHGLRSRSVAGEVTWLVEPLAERTLAALRARLEELLPGGRTTQGWLVEDKGVTIAVHHRLVAQADLEPVLTQVDAALRHAARDGGAVQTGKAVLELRPDGAEKGAALRSLSLGREGRATVMVGDDVTDESALAYTESQGGTGVLVATVPRATAASARLADPTAVVALLSALHDELSPGR